MSLLEKLKESRRSLVEAGGYKFKVERPTAADIEYIRVGAVGLSEVERGLYFRERFLGFVCDWPGMRELDIIPGGTGAALAFDGELFLAWVSDQPTIADTLANAVMQSWLDHNAAIEAAEKKPETGINLAQLPDSPPAS